VSYLLWGWALARTDASRVAVFSNLQPVATALLAWAVFGDPLTLHFVVATLCVLLGVALAA
jgi:drug/metabolite transporter (DMT)-like permease